jgi:pimeloyl-ACP methyl ester carboxylesterase
VQRNSFVDATERHSSIAQCHPGVHQAECTPARRRTPVGRDLGHSVPVSDWNATRDLLGAAHVMACSYDWGGVESMELQSRLPVRVAAFVGRERGHAKLADLVADARVVTLTGPRGCGKTRLAVEVPGDVASRFADGACWVDLQGVRESRLVAAAVGGTVDVHERFEEALTDTLAEQLRARQLLVVLDNCEHLESPVARAMGCACREASEPAAK